jgi:ankyrin repeat protein
VKVLLDGKADVNVKDGDGRTPLIVAAAGNMVDVARVLLGRGADMGVEDSLGRTAMMYASMNGREEMAELFKTVGNKK